MAAVTTPGGAQGGTALIAYRLVDAASRVASISVEYSVDGGATFAAASEGAGGDGTAGLATSPGGTAHVFAWDTATDLPEVYAAAVRVRITPRVTKVGTAGTSGDFVVDNNTPPVAAVTTPAVNQSGTALIAYTLADPGSQAAAIVCEYSVDGGATFVAATEGVGGEGRSGLATSPGGTGHTFAWDTAADLAAFRVVVFRITPSDAEAGTPGTSGFFAVDNSTPPVATVATPSGVQSGNVFVGYTLVDAESNASWITVEFSTDGGITFRPATLGSGGEGMSGLAGSPGGTVHRFAWDSAEDIPGESLATVRFRITPNDGEVGTAGSSGDFAIANPDPPTTRVSVDSGGAEATGGASGGAAVSDDGRYVAFSSAATNLVAGDTNGQADVFVRDRLTGSVERVSVDSTGAQALGGASIEPAISADGRYVAFTSSATNLATGDANGLADIFIRDRQAGTTVRVSVDSLGSEAVGGGSGAPALSADGRYVAFASGATNLVAGDANGASDVFARDTQAGTTVRVSVDSTGAEANGASGAPAISEDGRILAFESLASNLVAADTNGAVDVFVRDLQAGTTVRASLDTAGAQGNGPSGAPAVGAYGGLVAFESTASNLVAGDTNGAGDVFVRDLFFGETVRVSVDSAGGEANAASGRPSISTDGRFVTFESAATDLVAADTNGQADAFVRDRQTGLTIRVSVDSTGGEATGGASGTPAISADGRFVAFESAATDLVAGDANGQVDVFLWGARFLAPTVRVSVGSAGAQATGDSGSPAMSADGRYVAFDSQAADLILGDTNGFADVFVHDRFTGRVERVSVSSAGAEAGQGSSAPSISADGRFVAFESLATNLVPGDTNAQQDVFVHDRVTGVTERASVDSSGGQAAGSSMTPTISADGRFVAFASDAPDLVAGDANGTWDVFVRDRQTGTTTRVSVSSAGGEGNSGSGSPAISADGNVIAFLSQASNLVAGDGNGADDVFVHDRGAGTTVRASVDSSGLEGNGFCDSPAISADGLVVAFSSVATNLVAGDVNGQEDVFVHDLATGETTRVSVTSAGAEVGAFSTAGPPPLSADGRYVAFAADAPSLVPGDTNGTWDIYVHDRQTGATERVSVDSFGAEGTGFSFGPAMSGDGRLLSYRSDAADLVAGDTNGVGDVFLWGPQP